MFVNALLAVTLSQNSASSPRLQTAPTELPVSNFTQVGVSVFDLQVDENGAVKNQSVLYGEPPFVEQSLRSSGQWAFGKTAKASQVSATFFYEPQVDLPAGKFAFDVPVPNSGSDLQVPFPVRIVDPGHPAGLSRGILVLQLGLNPSGSVEEIRVVQGPPTLSDDAVAAVHEWKFCVPPGVNDPTAIVVVYFQELKLNVPAAEQSTGEKATLVEGTAAFAPIGSEGVLDTDDPAMLVFRYGTAHWVLPYPLVTNIEYLNSDTPADTLVTVTFSGTDNQRETVTFRLGKATALSTASVLSARTGKPITFRRSIASRDLNALSN